MGDVVLSYDDWKFPLDQEVVDWNHAYNGLIKAIMNKSDTPRTLVVLRDGKRVELSVAPGPMQIRLMSEQTSVAWLRTAANELSQR